MKRTTKYVTLDVLQATTTVSVREESGRVIAPGDPADGGTSDRGVLPGMRGAIHVTFEEGPRAQWLHERVVPRVDRVVVCDRRGKRRQGNRNGARCGSPSKASAGGHLR